MTTKYKYYFNTEDKIDYAMDIESPFKVTPDDHFYVDNLADKIGAEFYWEHDGWKTNWPVTFYLWDEDKKFITKMVIQMEMSPYFYTMGVE